MASAPAERKPQSGTPAAMDPARAFRAEIDRLFSGFGFPMMRRLFDGDTDGRSAGTHAIGRPAVDVTEDEKAYHITAELPGMSEQDVQVSLNDDILTLRGEKKQESEKKEANYYVAERSYGSFQRNFTIPTDVDREKIDAQFSKGVLTLTLPKTAQATSRKKTIEVKSG